MSPHPDANHTAATTPSSSELTLLSEVIRNVARTHRLRPEEAAGFSQTVHLRLLHRNYDVFTRFAGRSSLKTFLTVVVVRLLLDWRNSQYGKWRPSKHATRLGGHAVMLERLMSRDALSASEAVHAVLSSQTDLTRQDAEAIAASLKRTPKPRLVTDEGLEDRLAQPFIDPVAQQQRQVAERRIRTSLTSALRRLSDEDRDLVSARYARAETVQSFSKNRSADPKTMYRRLQRVLEQLRQHLRADGIDKFEASW